MKRDAEFWDRRADRYAKTPVRDEATYQKKLEITRNYLTPDSEVLEIGCGTGSTALAHAPFVRHILATDISPEMIRIARDKAKAAQLVNVTFEISAADDHDIADSRFDVIMALNLLHLLRDREALISAAYRGLKPGGAFVTSTACIGDMAWYFKLIAPIGRVLGLIPFVAVFTSDDLVERLLNAGFRIDREWLPKKNAAVFIVARKPTT